MPKFDREASGHDFRFEGMKTNARPDGMSPFKFPYAQNIREYSERSLQTRPQLGVYTASPVNAPVEAFEAELGVAKIGTGMYVGATEVDTGYAYQQGASLIPFRPNATPIAWEYVFDASKCTKINGGVVQNVGIVEPQAAIDFGTAQSLFTPLSTPTPGYPISYSHSGTASGITDTNKVTDTCSAVFQDPSLPPGTLPEYTCQVGEVTYQTGEFISIGTPDVDCYQIKDVYPAFTGTVQIAAIHYYAGISGRCVVVPYNVSGDDSEGLPTMQQNPLAGIRRGALVKLGTEVCYVTGTAVGLNGTISFEVVTVDEHFAGEVLSGQNAIKVLLSSNYAGVTPTAPVAGAAISAHYAAFTVGTGIGTISSAIGLASPFSFQNVSYRTYDYIHISILCNLYENLNEVKFAIDVSDGTFEKDFYYYALRPSDIQGAIANTLTQLGAAQIAAQRDIIDQESKVRGQSTSSLPLFPGDGMWCDVFIPISQLQRYGTNQTLTLLNANSYQILVNCNADVSFGFHTLDLCGGYSLDTSATGIEYRWRCRPRNSVTGAKGNACPEPRYGLRLRRESALVVLPDSYPDPQMDTWDIFRIGGSLSKYTFAGSVMLGQNFIDNYSDLDIELNDILEDDNYQPFPTVENPFTGTAQLYGHVAVVTATSANPPTNIEAYLPGNILTVGQQNYSLWARPTLITPGVYLFQLEENSGTGSSICNIYEPLLAAQPHPYAWGPDASGVIFSTGDTYRPGGVSWTNGNNPDSASNKNYAELSPPTEPLIGGVLNDGTSFAASMNRWWQGYPSENGYNWLERPIGAGLAFPWAITSDGKSFYFVGRDGIYVSGGGRAESLTDADLYNLFPHEGVYAQNIVTPAGTIYAPAYNYGFSFRLSVINGFLFFDYWDSTGTSRTLRMMINKLSWAIDVYADPVTCRAATTAPPTNFGGVPTQQMFLGAVSGAIYMEQSKPHATGEKVYCSVYTAEDLNGDLRAPKLYGDASLDCTPASGMTVTPIFLGTLFTTSTNVLASASRELVVVELNGEQQQRSMGLVIQWEDAGGLTHLYSWQPSYIVKPEFSTDRFEDWDNCGYSGNKFIQGFLLTADTADQVKKLTVRDADTLTTHDFTGPTLIKNDIRHNGQSEIAYSFVQAFRCHLVRYEPDEVSWQDYGIRWIFQPCPESAIYWQCQPSSFSINGWMHVQRVLFSYASTAPVTLNVNVDGVNYVYTLPNTNGAFLKKEVILTATKGLVFTLSAFSTGTWSAWQEDMEILVKPWGSPEEYRREKVIGSSMGNEAKV